MRGFVVRAGGLAAAVAMALTGVAQADPSTADGPAARQEAAYFEFTAPSYSAGFVVKITKQEEIDNARAMLADETGRRYIVGRIVKRPAPYNPRWSFHYNPDSVAFSDGVIEVCDAGTEYVEDHLDEAGGAFLPGLIWCPWSAKLVREVPTP
ncbi:hypothetical protein [Umezawaea sp. Da 62-37]|uniref:BP74-related protein n=1 Tax=Umezawaea sp. Da 62-37 TaxID=3075927 RepID=UPI0028F744A8|nr:hypothetical protein [Umezawaea sp. Da 62-37]WNV86449.1 hypothetical protein RM788_51455 [Umezawaea sp. Da 62-37]